MFSTVKISDQCINNIPDLIINRIISNEKKITKAISVFDSTGEEINFKYYFNRIASLSEAEKPTILSSLILIDRFINKSNIVLTYKNINKIFFISFYICLKHLEDVIFKIHDFSKISGMSTRQISFLENVFLEAIDFSFPVDSDIYYMYLVRLLNKE